MKTNAMGVIFHREGDTVVLTDPAGKQYVCSTPQELWADMNAILGDGTLPKMLVEAAPEATGADGAPTKEDARAMFDSACEQASEFVGDAYGPFFGKLAQAATKRGGPAAFNFLKSISRNGKQKVGG